MSVRRLVVFDIDGTLVTGGPAKAAFHAALLEVFGTAGTIEGHEFSGKTDPQIARELLRGAGLADEEIDHGFPALWRRYLDEMEARLADAPVRVLPGVERVLDALEAEEGVRLGLLTGNIRPGARLKLRAGGLPFERFEVGGFGSDDERRNRLPSLVLARARERWGIEVPPDCVIVIGDTPRDVACGRHGGCRTLAVATGRFPVEELERAEPDRVVPDLSGAEDLVDWILDGEGV